MEYYITESTKKAKGKKYKCPYCEKRDYKVKLVKHIEKEHQPMIPKDYTAARVVFNTINKKDHGTCVCGCGRETAWREDLWRYDRYATDQCREKYSKEMKERMVRIYGKEHLLNDPHMQNKMLNARSISGSYKFSRGGKIDYVGSYEKQFLEFCDKVMNYRVRDIEQPGPTIRYVYDNQEHFWITDFYIPSANLVLDIKDGGDNPNNREMESYREKQKCKEAAIIEQGKYNYIRLTNNNFAQLMLILAEIKERMIDSETNDNKEYEPVIRINEATIFTINESSEDTEDADKIIDEIMECIIGITPNGRRFSDIDSFVINYTQKGNFDSGQAFAIDPEMKHMITVDKNGGIKLYDRKLLENSIYEVYKFNGKKYKMPRKPQTLFEMLTGSELIDKDQMKYDSRFEQVFIPSYDMQIEAVEATLLGDDLNIPTMTGISIKESGIDSYVDSNGIYIKNSVTGLRSKSYVNEADIPQGVITLIRKGEI